MLMRWSTTAVKNIKTAYVIHIWRVEEFPNRATPFGFA